MASKKKAPAKKPAPKAPATSRYLALASGSTLGADGRTHEYAAGDVLETAPGALDHSGNLARCDADDELAAAQAERASAEKDRQIASPVGRYVTRPLRPPSAGPGDDAIR